jgi:hypothetical protein
MSGTENSPTATLEEHLRLGAGFATGRTFSRPCPHSRRTCLDGSTTRSTSRCH